MTTTALGQLAANNDIVMIGDANHSDGQISRTVHDHLGDMQKNNIKHLFVEQDPNEWTPEGLAAIDNEKGRLVKDALDRGMSVHLYDDRSRHREREGRYPDEHAHILANDPYRTDTDALIAGAPNPEKMRAFLKEDEDNHAADMAFRNERMAENISNTMKQHPGEGAAVVLGDAHLTGGRDVDEMLRERGHSVTTANIVTKDTNAERAATAADKPDFVLNEQGDALSFKQPGTNTMRGQLEQGESVPWRNSEPVAAKSPMEAAMEAARGVDCSWAKPGAAASANAGQLGELSCSVPQGNRASEEVLQR